MTARTAFTVKNPATTIMTTATAKFVPIILMAAIHPLSTQKHTEKSQSGQISITNNTTKGT